MFISVLLAVPLAGWGSEKSEPVVLQLPFPHPFQFAGVQAAIDQGYFAAEGLEVVLQTGTIEKQPSPEVAAGRAQYGIGQAEVLADRLNGQPLVAVAVIFQHSPFGVMVRQDGGIATPVDLVGRRIAMSPYGRYTEMRAMFAAEGIKNEQFQRVADEWPQNELVTGEADAISIFESEQPFEATRLGLDFRLIRPADYGVDFYGDTLFTNESELKARPERVAAMRRALLRGWEYALAHPEEMIDRMLAKNDAGGMDARERLRFGAQVTARLIHAELVEIGHMNPGRWKRMAEHMVAMGEAASSSRLEGFLYDSSDNSSPWIHWLGLSLLVAVLVILLSIMVSRRLQSLVRRRTAELEISEQLQREYFELAPAPIVIEDYTALEPVLTGFRAEGVKNLGRHLEARPELVRELLKKKRIVAANRLALARAGFATVAEFEKGLASIMTPETYDSFIGELVAIWQDVDRLTMERSYRRNDGGEIYAILNWEVSRKDGQRDLAKVQLVFTEITEQKKAERAMRESEARYRLLFEHSPLAVVEFDQAGLRRWFEELRSQGVTDLEAYLREHPEAKQELLKRSPLRDANETTLRLVGASSKAEVAARLAEILTESGTRVRCELAIGIWNGRTTATGEIEVRRLDGEARTLSYFWKMQTDEAGRPAFTRTQTVLVDITEKIATERALRESETRYRELFEQAVGGIYRTGPAGDFQSVNPAMAQICGFATPAEMIAWSAHVKAPTLYVKPGRREEFVAALNRSNNLTGFESEIRTKDGMTVWISETVRAVRDEAGQLQYYEGFVTDISTRRQLEAEIGRASKLEAVGILAGGIAHDFNNILTVVLGNVTLAEADVGPGNPVAKQLSEAKQATLRARDLTLQLLTFAKGGEPVRAMIELGEVLKESAGFALHGAKARGEFSLPPELWRVSADKGQIGQVIHNLVINAVQAMPEGGVVTIAASNVELPLKTVEMLPLPPGRYVQISVADTGVGIAPEQLAKIFDPYFTTKAHGSGLGLATTYSVVRKHEGHIQVESEPGKGTLFRFWLPAGAKAVVVSTTGSGSSRSPFHARVLFMDDEESIRAMAVIFMKRIGYACEVAADGAEAVRKYQQALEAGDKYAVVVMDLTVPGGMGGLQAMEQLRRIDPAVCAIVSSGYSRDPVLANYRAHGFQAILPKPYGLDQLTKVMRSVMDGPGNPS